MKQTYYATHVIEFLQGLVPQNRNLPDRVNNLKYLAERLKSSIKFRLPEGGDLLQHPPKTNIKDILQKGPMRLPFPCICVEYDSDPSIVTDGVPYKKTVALAFESGDEGITVWPFNYALKTPFSDEGWMIFAGINFTLTTFKLVPLDDGMAQRLAPEIRADIDEFVTRNFGNECLAIASLMAALACRNVSTIDIDPDPAFVKARKRRGKEPVYSYKVLHIETPLSSTAGASIGGTHASPRIHLRRGHIRRLPSHTVWVNACVVGNKERGILAKDYSLHHRQETAS
jgi:hypothetical protein